MVRTSAVNVGLAWAALTASAVALPSIADAQTFLSERYRQPGESRQDVAFELRAGSWLPNIANRGFDPGSPYPNAMGMPGVTNASAFDRFFRWPNAGGGGLLALGGEVDWQILRMGPVGSFGVGLQAYYAWASAKAPLASTSTSADPGTWTRTDQLSQLTVVPVTALAVVRFDGLARAVRYLPLVPYVKFGLTYGFWWVSNGDEYARGTGADGNATDAVGGTLGFTGAVGLQLMLDAFEPTLARQFDTTMGVNHSYVFFEGYMQNLGFGSSSRLDVGTLTWSAGLTFEY